MSMTSGVSAAAATPGAGPNNATTPASGAAGEARDATSDGALNGSGVTNAAEVTPQAWLSTAAAGVPATVASADALSTVADVNHIDTALSGLASGLTVVDEIAALKVAADHLKAVLNGIGADACLVMLTSLYLHPIDWSVAFVKSFSGVLLQIVLVPINILLAILSWAGQATECLIMQAGVGLAEVTLGNILGPTTIIDNQKDSCRGYDKFKTELAQWEALYDEVLEALGAFVNHPLDWTSEVLDLLTIAAETAAETLASNTNLRDKIDAYMSDPTNAGTLCGAVVANVLLFVEPGGDEVGALVDAADGINLAAREAEADTQIQKATPELQEAQLPAELMSWITAFKALLKADKLRMGGKIGEGKYQILRKLGAFTKLGPELIGLARERVYSAVVNLRGRVGSYTAMRNLAGQLNAHSEFMYMLELEKQGTFAISAGETVTHTATVAEQVLESAHLVDARFFDYFPQAERDALGWKGPDDMPAVLATAFEHRRSYPNYFAEVGGASQLPEDLKEFNSITKFFMTHIIKVDAAGNPVKGELKAASGAVKIGPTAKASDIIKAHLDLWQTKQFNAQGGIATKGVISALQDLLANIASGQ
jgi:hypothetical protein